MKPPRLLLPSLQPAKPKKHTKQALITAAEPLPFRNPSRIFLIPSTGNPMQDFIMFQIIQTRANEVRLRTKD